MKQVPQTELLHEVKHTIKGNEPFLSFTRPRMVVNLFDSRGQSHILYEDNIYFPFSCHMKKGDTLKFKVVRESWVDSPWYERAILLLPKSLRVILFGWVWDGGKIGDGTRASWERLFK